MPLLTIVPSTLVTPEIPVDYSGLPVLTGDATGLLHEFLALLSRDVQQGRLPDAWIEVRGTTDPEDDTTQILVRLWTKGLSDRDARQYQNVFGLRVDDWTRSLSEDQKRLFSQKISFQTRRTADA